MRESRTYGSVRGALSNGRPYRDQRHPGALHFRDLPLDIAALTGATLARPPRSVMLSIPAVSHGTTTIFAGKSLGRKSAE